MSHTDIDKHVRTYMVVFVSLMVLTVVTVAVSYLDVSTPVAVALALFIASIKGALVACYFMHLISEKQLILWVLLFTMMFFFFELVGFVITEADNIGQPG